MSQPSASLAGVRRTAGVTQGFALVFLATVPTMAIVSLVPNLPQMFREFGQLPHASLLVPMVFTIPSLCIALASPLIGSIADRWGRRPVLIGSLCCCSSQSA
jgi:MFS family permease